MSTEDEKLPFFEARDGLSAESSFFALCAFICRQIEPSTTQSEAPLRGRVDLRSHISPAFQPCDLTLWLEPKTGASQRVILEIAFLTLAGGGGALPWWITEKILSNQNGEGQALHGFLDLLNRRFWELLFLAQSAGNNPHYGFRSRRQVQLSSELSYAIVGINSAITFAPTPNSATFLHKIKQQCWAAGGGLGGIPVLTGLLSEACGCSISVRQHVPVRLEVAKKACLFLGGNNKNQLSANSGILGSKAWVVCGLLLSVTLLDADDIDEYFPVLTGKNLIRLCQVLEIFYGQSLPPVFLQLRCPVTASFSCLGHRQLRLGWGATLSNCRPASQLIKLSLRAMNDRKNEALI